MTSAEALFAQARAARERAVAPMSNYRVGAAALAADGTVWLGCNIEDITLHETICAEKVALFKAISEGHRRFPVVAVYTEGEPPATPCGSCRQVLAAWGCERVIWGNAAGFREISLSELLPLAFTAEALDHGKDPQR